MKAYYERFGEELRAALPEGFTVTADATIAVAHYATACLVGFIPSPADKRKPVTKKDVREWIEREARSLRRNAPHFTPDAKSAANLLLSKIEEENR